MPTTTTRAATPTNAAPDAPTASALPDAVNEVRLVGRLSAPPEVRELPSGDTLVAWRLVVPRDGARHQPGRAGRTPGVDTIDCAAYDGRIRRRSVTWTEGSWLAVEGLLHRRFWQSPGGLQSRYEVEVVRATVVQRAR